MRRVPATFPLIGTCFSPTGVTSVPTSNGWMFPGSKRFKPSPQRVGSHKWVTNWRNSVSSLHAEGELPNKTIFLSCRQSRTCGMLLITETMIVVIIIKGNKEKRIVMKVVSCISHHKCAILLGSWEAWVGSKLLPRHMGWSGKRPRNCWSIELR